MNIDEKVIQLIGDFVENCDIELNKKNGNLINSAEVYYKSHTFLEVLKMIEKNEKSIVLRDKLLFLTEAVLELDK
jgi:hypothetical protein